MLSASAVGANGGGGSCGDSIVTMNMEISPQHHPIVLGKVSINSPRPLRRTKKHAGSSMFVIFFLNSAIGGKI